MQRRMLVLCVHCVFHALPSCHHHCSSSHISCIGHAASEEAALGNRVKPCGSHPQLWKPRASIAGGFRCEAGRRAAQQGGGGGDVGAEEVVKEEPEPKEESVDAQEDLEEELAWKAEEDEEKEEEEKEGIYSQSTAAGTSTSASQSLSQASWQPLLQDSEATEHGLELADAAGMQEPRGGFADLREEEKERLLTVNASLAKEITYVLRGAAFTVKSLSFSSSLRSAKPPHTV